MTEKEIASTKIIQDGGLKILTEINRICEKHNIPYILDYGTLLGAVRHQGFIPWDDDVDIAMKQSDYDKFKNIIIKELPRDMFLQDHDSDSNYYLPFSKIKLIDNNIVEKNWENFDIIHGVWIDIFLYLPQDNIAYNSEIITKFNKNFKFLDYITPTLSRKNSLTDKLLKDPIKKTVISLLIKSQRKNTRGIFMKFLDSQYEKMISNIIQSSEYNDNNNLINFSMNITPENFNELLLTNYSFSNRILCDFEGFEFYIPENFHEVLENRYGDYMKLPILEERKPSHNILFKNL